MFISIAVEMEKLYYLVIANHTAIRLSAYRNIHAGIAGIAMCNLYYQLHKLLAYTTY